MIRYRMTLPDGSFWTFRRKRPITAMEHVQAPGDGIMERCHFAPDVGPCPHGYRVDTETP